MQETDRQAEQGSVQVQLERPLIFVLTVGILLLALISGINVLYSFLYAMLVSLRSATSGPPGTFAISP